MSAATGSLYARASGLLSIIAAANRPVLWGAASRCSPTDIAPALSPRTGRLSVRAGAVSDLTGPAAFWPGGHLSPLVRKRRKRYC